MAPVLGTGMRQVQILYLRLIKDQTHTHSRIKIMSLTPYELRFNIFQLAQSHLLEEYHNKIDTSNPVQFPNYEQISILAEKINNFVSRDTK